MIETKSLNKNGFTFKRFFVAHDKSPMKITTDSVLLGVWAPVDRTIERILDIGTGCGVIALMLAQRAENLSTKIDAIDISEQAIRQCQQNIDSSPFKNKLHAELADLNNYKISENGLYDMIVCNPPYFEPATLCRDMTRQQARYTESLSHTQLIGHVKRLLKENGFFALVLPYYLSDSFIFEAEKIGLSLFSRMDIRYTDDKVFSLVLICLIKDKQPKKVKIDELTMRHNDNSYTARFKSLLKDFYLRF